MRLTELDYYAALDVLPGAPVDQIERAYRFALQSYSADSLAIYGLVDETERREIEAFLNEAMRVLGNEHLRSQYDKRLRESNQYSEEQMRRKGGPEIPELADPQLPILPPRASAAAKAPAPVFEPGKPEEATPPPHPPAPAPVHADAEVKPKSERSWWPFTEKDKAVETAAPAQTASAPVPAPAPAASTKSVGEDTAPLERPAAPAVISALDGRPIGGGELRQIREARGLRLEEISNRTKISLSTLRAIEDSTFKFLPAPVYLKGFLRTYSKMLQIDADKVIADYMRNFEAHKG